MGFSNEEFEKIMEMEGGLEKDFSIVSCFNNKLACEYSGNCSFEKVRLGLAIVKDQKYCSKNPGRKECGAYQYLEGLVKK